MLCPQYSLILLEKKKMKQKEKKSWSLAKCQISRFNYQTVAEILNIQFFKSKSRADPREDSELCWGQRVGFGSAESLLSMFHLLG